MEVGLMEDYSGILLERIMMKCLLDEGLSDGVNE